MLSKCANPACSTALVYLREGKIFMMDGSVARKKTVQGPVPAKTSGPVEHFWLCGPCSEHLTLVCDPDGAMQVVPKEPAIKRAIAS